MTIGVDAKFIDRLIGDRRGDNLPVADIDPDMGGGRTFFDFENGAFDLVACTDAHNGLHTVGPRSIRRGGDGLPVEQKMGLSSRLGRRAYGTDGDIYYRIQQERDRLPSKCYCLASCAARTF